MCRWNTTLLFVKPTKNLATSTSPDGETLLLQEHDGEYFLKIGGVPLMSTIACSSEQTMAELACGGRARKQRGFSVGVVMVPFVSVAGLLVYA